MLGELKSISPREVWRDEARDFTPWIAENLGRLSEALGLDLDLKQQEAAVGNFSCDVVATDVTTNQLVIIENQFGTTDHDHLGKLITYASGLGAAIVVWITERLREEHRQAVEWLNQHTDEDLRFFVLTVEVLQIDDSPFAAHFEPVVVPNEWQRAARRSTRQESSREEAYRQFFTPLIDELREKHHFTNARIGSASNWQGFTIGVRGANVVLSFSTGGRVRVELYIDFPDPAANKPTFDHLYTRRHEIENALGEPLSWERLDNRKASRIAVYRDGDVHSSPEEQAAIRRWGIERLLKFKQVFVPVLKEVLAARLVEGEA